LTYFEPIRGRGKAFVEGAKMIAVAFADLEGSSSVISDDTNVVKVVVSG
jgi:hypothetical protein